MAKLPPILVPSILAGDHANLSGSVQTVARLGLTWIHVDIMDGHFVPNLTFGPATVQALRQSVPAGLFLDVHLMLDKPQLFVEPFANAGASLISIHIEPDYDVPGTLRRIRQLGCKCGIVLNPATSVEAVGHVLADVDLVLVMTVQPGFGGQPFRTDMMPKLEKLDALRQERELKFRLEVDGGIDLETAPVCRRAGADTFVAGTAFFKATDKHAFAAAFAAL